MDFAFILTFLLLVCSVKCYQLIDLTHPAHNGYTICWPTHKQFNLTINFRGLRSDGLYVEANDFQQSEHCGTHTDAPAHFHQGAWRVGDIPIEKLVGPGVVIDIREKVRNDRDSVLDFNDVLQWEKEHGQIPSHSVVIMNSGNSLNYENRSVYFGWPSGMDESDPDFIQHMHFPGFDSYAVKWLSEQRQIIGIAVDTPSTDHAQSKEFETHKILGQLNLFGIENIANVDSLPARGFTLFNMAYKLKEGSGAPTRVFAILDGNSSGISTSSSLHLLTVSAFLLKLIA